MEEEIEKFHKTDDGKEEKKEEAVEDDFVCSCCFEILLEPTTLTCGHTFCRFCLANWWDMSRKAECLQCRRPFNEFPNVNFTLRNTLEKLFPEKIRERHKALESQPNFPSVLNAFESHAESDRSQANERRNENHFNCGTLCIISSLIIAIIILIAIGMRTLFGGPEVLLDGKVITEWNCEDVAYWVGEQGPWAKGIYDDRFRSADIDGSLLLKMKEEDLIGPPINMHLGLHRRVLIEALKQLQSRQKNRPGDFWEFKAANRAKALFLLFGLRQFPRTMLLYLYFFDYHEILLPFLHQTCKLNAADSLPPIDPVTQKAQPDLEQWRSFVIRAMSFPYFMIGYYASGFLSVNYWISRIVILHSVAMGLLEASSVWWLFSSGGFRALPGMLLKNLIWVLGCSLLLKILWPFVPFFICDMIFSWMFFISPFDAVNRLFQKINNFRHAPIPRERNAGWQFDFHFHRE